MDRPDKKAVRLFRNDREALFVRRPNRFLIIAEPDVSSQAAGNNEEIICHCPNPGRLIEFTFPGTRLILEQRAAGKRDMKTQWTAAGLYYKDRAVPLFSSRANRAAEELILPGLIPDLREIHPEYTLNGSRFDFLCISGSGKKHLIEVKACSLVEYGAAMFPDAPSARALKHLEELAELAGKDYVCHVLFVIVHGNPRRFIPNLHTDPAFAAALSRCRERVNIRAALLRCGPEGRAVLAQADVPADLSHGSLAEQNRGSYLILLKLEEEQDITVGALGHRRFEAGWYVYAGSAQKNLSQRVARHLRKIRKKKHWHLDYLTPCAVSVKAFPVFSYTNLECSLARSLDALGGKAVPGFGSSDCRCESHLFYFSEAPMARRDFVDMILRFRHSLAFERSEG